MQKIVFLITCILTTQLKAHSGERLNTCDVAVGKVLVESTALNTGFAFAEAVGNRFSQHTVLDLIESDMSKLFAEQPLCFENVEKLFQETEPISIQTRFYKTAFSCDSSFNRTNMPQEPLADTKEELFRTDVHTLLPDYHVPSIRTYDGTLFNSRTLQLFAGDTYLQELMVEKMKEADQLVENRDYRQGIALYKKILNVGQKWSIDKNVLFDATRSLGNVYVVRKQYDSAIIYQRSAFVLADKLQLGIDKKIDAYRDIGITFAEMGRLEASLATYKKTIEIALAQKGGERNLGVLYLLVAGHYEKLRFYDTMSHYLEKYKALEITVFHDADLEFHRLSSIYHKAKGEYKLALQELERMNMINDSLYTLNLSDKVLTLNKQDKIETIEKESVLLQRKNTNKIRSRVQAKNKRIYYLKGLLVGLCVIALFIFIALYKNNRLTKELARMNETIHIQRNEIVASLNIEKDLNKKLQKSKKTLEHFFSIIAHDLRSPYNVMLGYADMLVDNYDLLKSSDIKDCLKVLRKKAYKNYQLTQNLLSWAMMQKGGIIVNKRESYVRKIIYASFSLHKELADKKGITLINNCPINLTGCLDKDIAASVLSNLISNALKFTNKCGSVTISAKKLGKNILFKIDDTGLGMCKRTRKNLFNLNKVSSRPGTADEPGAGLGLILCQELVATHEGALRVKSKVGKGTTVLALL